MATPSSTKPSPGAPAGTAGVPRLTFIPDILEEHLAELAFLWGQRLDALRSAEYTYDKFLDLEDRIAAHLHGVHVVGERGLPLIEEGLASDDALEVFASAFSMLNMGDAALEARVLILFAGAKGARLEGLRLALRHGASPATIDRVTMLAHGKPGPVAAAAAEVLAIRSRLGLDRDRLHAFLSSDEAGVREAGWRLAGLHTIAAEPAAFEAALHDEDAGVRRAALLAGAWCGQPRVLAVARKAALEPTVEDADALYLLAVLGTQQDVPALEAIARSGAMQAEGLRLLASLGHASTIGTILRALENADSATAVAAGAAFLKVTGVDVAATTLTKLPPAGGEEPDEFDAEFQDEVALPDAGRAHREWNALKQHLEGAPRIARGLDLGREFTPETFAALDMESRWEACLRGRFYGTWAGSPLWLEVYPQPR